MPTAIPPESPRRVCFLGYPVDSLTMGEAVAWVENAISKPRFHHIAVINANKMWLADKNPALRAMIQDAELVIPEYAVVWGCKVLGTPVRGHIGGIMLLKELLPWLESKAIPVYFLGARTNIITEMGRRLRDEYPKLQIAGLRSGYFHVEDSASIVQAINASGAKILFVAMGSPRQETWIEAQRRNLAVRLAIGVGGSFDVLAGLKKDTPNWMRHGGEWIYRLAQDPRNLWKRYLTTNPWFVAQVVRQRIIPCKM